MDDLNHLTAQPHWFTVQIIGCSLGGLGQCWVAVGLQGKSLLPSSHSETRFRSVFDYASLKTVSNASLPKSSLKHSVAFLKY